MTARTGDGEVMARPPSHASGRGRPVPPGERPHAARAGDAPELPRHRRRRRRMVVPWPSRLRTCPSSSSTRPIASSSAVRLPGHGSRTTSARACTPASRARPPLSAVLRQGAEDRAGRRVRGSTSTATSRACAQRRARSTLEVTWETLAILDTTTSDRLLASLDEAIGRLDDEIRTLERGRARRSLRVVNGGR